MSPLKLGRSQSGLTLAEVMIAVAIVGVIMLVLSTVGNNFFSAKKMIDRQAELEDFKLLVRSNLRCPATLAAIGSPCAAGRAVALRGPLSGSTMTDLIPATGTVVAKYRIVAQCTSTNPKEWRVSYVDTTVTPLPAPQELFVPRLGCL